MNSISLIFTYYKNPQMLTYQWRIWQTYPEHVEIVLVDDGSPVGFRAEEVMARMPKLTCRFKLARVLVDLPWNQCGGRNLGVHLATSQWEMITDIDHVVTLDFVNAICGETLDVDTIYSFQRLHHFTREPYRAHWESKLMTRDKFWSIGGFDESFCGHYAFSERNWLRKVKQLKNGELPYALEHVNSDEIEDSKTVGLVRKEGRDDPAWQEIIEWKERHRISVELLKLPWKLVFDSTRPTETTA